MSQAPVLQIPDFNREFVLVNDASDLAISADLNQGVGKNLAPISFYSRLFSPAERTYSTYEKECLAVLFRCEKCPYLEHTEFELHCDNFALCWLLKRVKEIGRIGRWVLSLAPFKFRVVHTKSSDNVVADALSRVFEGNTRQNPEMKCATILESLPLVYSSLEEHEMSEQLCKDLRQKVTTNSPGSENFQIRKNLVSYNPKGAKRGRWVIPSILWPMLLHYFHDSVLAGHLGAFKTYHKIASNFWWPKMSIEISEYIRKCALCQRAKPAQNTQHGLHAAHPLLSPWRCTWTSLER